MTFEAVAKLYLAAHQATWKNAKHRQQWRNTIDTYVLPTLGRRMVAAVDTGAVMAIIEPIWSTKPETASRVRGRIESVLDYAAARGWRSGDNPARWRGLVENLLPARAKVAVVEHHAALPWAEIGGFMEEVSGQAGIAALALRFCILTEARTGEVTRTLSAHTPELFNLNALDFDYEPQAAAPLHRINFLNALWPNDESAIAALQEMFGLLLTGDTRHQKAFLVVGSKRSGKGTIARVLTRLVGPSNVCGPTLSSLAQNFGLAPLIGKRVAVISDARLSGKVDAQIIVERILSITGEDSLTVDRKFRDGWTGKLDTRFLILTNELPKLSDASGALASRFVLLTLTSSFFGKEDLGLTERLVKALPGILGWAIDGWERLAKRGHFIPPASSKIAQEEMEDLASPIGAFLRKRCVIKPGASETCEAVYEAWLDWCRHQNREHVGNTQDFGRNLRAAAAGVEVRSFRKGEVRGRRYEGLGLKISAEIEEAEQEEVGE